MSQFAVDTNILAYAAGLRRVEADDPKIEAAARLIDEHANAGVLSISAQAFAELHNLLRRKMKLDGAEAGTYVSEYMAVAECQPTTGEVLAQAMRLARDHRLQTFDAIILAAAAGSGCHTLYSEDLQHGFVWSGVQVVNPFAP